ncbi:MAG TPA: PEP-CTERM sorting domain-containing protein, partial [Burkholderiaceae bacterium]
ALFRSLWNLSASVKVIGSNANNLGRADEINLFDANGTLVSRLSYGDQTFAGTIRTQNFSGNPTSLADLEVQTVSSGWVLASVGDAYGSYASALSGASFDVGNPGFFALATPVPEPTQAALLASGLLLLSLRRSRGNKR